MDRVKKSQGRSVAPALGAQRRSAVRAWSCHAFAGWGHWPAVVARVWCRRQVPEAGCRGQVPGGGCRKLDAVGQWLLELLAVIPSLSPLLPWWN